MPEGREGLLIEAVDQGVLVGADIGAERLGAIHQNFVGIRAEHGYRLRVRRRPEMITLLPRA
jgi:hypothetical protein